MSRITAIRKTTIAALCGLSWALGGWQAAQAHSSPQREAPQEKTAAQPAASAAAEGNRIPPCH
ncbi:hypothetical protein [Brenneria corticis]|uniref:Uncharacterized protein n=1 Tax=Brenneria corticis TaxID=2173106 RepID=A0A2U1U372_9GAMM|nr:hypothetical protein [Brenneria sp. CFCC 11842]PWC16105.1 hypothetical protein DDT56_11425 [Brenneria sp. CFCC 11842]